MKTKIGPQILLYHKITNYSLLGILIGIFLLPQLASLSSVSPEKIIELTNKEREAAGINTLTANQLLAKAAYEKGLSIFSAQAFRHNIGDRKFSDWIRRAGYNYSYVGENLAIDFVTDGGAMSAWMKSDTHRKNIMNPAFSEIGVAVMDGVLDGKNTTLIVQIFGSPRSPVNTGIASLSTTVPPLNPAIGNDAVDFRHCFDYAGTAEGTNLLTGVNEVKSIKSTTYKNLVKTADSGLPSGSYPTKYSFLAIMLALGLLHTGRMRRNWNLFITGKNKQLRLPLK